MFKIEKGIQLPKGKETRNSYPFAKMEVGDSFYVPADDKGFRTDKRGRRYHPAGSASSAYGRAHGKKFKCLFDEKRGLRIWRVE